MTPIRSWQLTRIVAVSAAAIIVLMQGCGGGSAADMPVNGLTKSASQGDPRSNNDPVIGVWEVTLSVPDCVTGAVQSTTRCLGQVHAGSTAVADNSTLPDSHRQITGTWQNEGHGQYSYQMVFLRFDPDRSWMGSSKAKGTCTLASDGNSFQNLATRQLLDRVGTVLGQICATEDGQRITC